MSSAIGQYVHYHAANYLAYGNKQKSKYPTGGIMSYWKKTHSELKAKISQAVLSNKSLNIKDIETEYNNYRAAILGQKDGLAQETYNAIISVLAEKYQLSLSSFDLNENDTLDLGILKGDAQRARQLRKAKEGNTKVELSKVSTVLSRITKANEAINRWETGTEKEKMRIRKALDKLKAEVKQAAKDFQSTYNQAQKDGRQLNITLPENYISSASAFERQTARNFINEINKIVAVILLKDANKIIADFEELLGLSIELQRDGIALTAANQKLAEAFEKGGSNKTQVILPDFLSINRQIANELAENGNFQFRTTTGTDAEGKTTYSYEYKMSESQQKADATFTIDGKVLGLSIKSYDLTTRRPISLVSGTPLLNLLAGYEINSVEYANHFLNVLAYHPDSGYYGGTWSTIRNLANETLALHILYAAATGRWTGKTEGFAEILTIKDKSKPGGVKMYDLAEIIKTMSKNMNSIYESIKMSSSDNFTNFELTNDYQVSNGTVGTSISRRLTLLLASAHSKKISVAISTANLT